MPVDEDPPAHPLHANGDDADATVRSASAARNHNGPSDSGPSDAYRSEAFMTRAMTTWGDAVYRMALGQTRSRTDAEDVYQDVFLRLFGDSTEFQSDEHLHSWLLRVTLNRCRDLAKSSWKQRSVPFDPVRNDVAQAAEDPRDAAVWDAVGQLPENLRSAVHLHYVEGYSTNDIARIMHCRPATARTWLHRARIAVREFLSGPSRAAYRAATPPAVAAPAATASPISAESGCDRIRKEASHDR